MTKDNFVPYLGDMKYFYSVFHVIKDNIIPYSGDIKDLCSLFHAMKDKGPFPLRFFSVATEQRALRIINRCVVGVE